MDRLHAKMVVNVSWLMAVWILLVTVKTTTLENIANYSTSVLLMFSSINSHIGTDWKNLQATIFLISKILGFVKNCFPIFNRQKSSPSDQPNGKACVNGGFFNTTNQKCNCIDGFTGNSCEKVNLLFRWFIWVCIHFFLIANGWKLF